MNGIEIFIDESGDFGKHEAHCPYYVVTMVFHESVDHLYDIQSRLSQVADLVCTMKRIGQRLSDTGTLTKSELYFFGSEKNFRRNWLKSLMRSEWK